MNSKRRWAIRVTFLAVSVFSIPAFAHDDGPHSPRRALNGMPDGVEGRALNGMRDGEQAKALNGMRDSSEGRALNGMRDGVEGRSMNGMRDGDQAKALNGMRDGAQAKALNGMRDGEQAKALNGMRDGAEGRALNGMRDGEQAKALNGMRDGVEGRALNGMRDGVHAQALNGVLDRVQVRALNGMRDGLQAQALNGIHDDAQAQALNGMQDRVRLETRSDPLTSWITSDPEVRAERLELAHYIVQCAMAPGDDRIVHVDGKTFTFRGVFGLLPSWTSGNAMSNAEYQLLIACLGAHVNPLGEHVPISIRGPGIRVDTGEPEEFPIREGAFFALADGSGALTTYACSADFAPHEGDDSRLCSEPGRCSSVIGLGSCSNICHLDDEGNFLCSNGGLEIAGVVTTYMQSRMN